MKTIGQCVEEGSCDKFLLTEKGEKICSTDPEYPEAHELWVNSHKSTMKWKLVFQKVQDDHD